MQRVVLFSSIVFSLNLLYATEGLSPDQNILAPTKNIQLEAAMADCLSGAPQETHGKPSHSFVDECMKKKGFIPPSSTQSKPSFMNSIVPRQ